MAIIEVNGLVKRYGDPTAVNGVGSAVGQGDVFGFVTGVALATPEVAQAQLTGCAAL
jgi:ABC-type uncharacterized transport system ATPase subunit